MLAASALLTETQKHRHRRGCAWRPDLSLPIRLPLPRRRFPLLLSSFAFGGASGLAGPWRRHIAAIAGGQRALRAYVSTSSDVRSGRPISRHASARARTRNSRPTRRDAPLDASDLGGRLHVPRVDPRRACVSLFAPLLTAHIRKPSDEDSTTIRALKQAARASRSGLAANVRARRCFRR